jgi:predicted DNA-binding ribbon-helix-helix protein
VDSESLINQGKIMKQILLVAAVVTVLAGCAGTSNDRYERRADAERERLTAQNERAVSEAPKWMAKLPESKDAVYANGSAVSPDMSMSADKAKLVAMGKICMAAGGTVDQRNTMFRTDTENASVEKSELAIRGMCRSVDISGAEIAEVKTIAEGNRFRTYVLVALPTGEANAVQRRKDQIRLQGQALKRSDQVFQEMDKPVQ